MPEAPVLDQFETIRSAGHASPGERAKSPPNASGGLMVLLGRRWRLGAVVLGSLLAACLLYCLVAPEQYEAKGRVGLRASALGALSLDGSSLEKSGSFASGQTQLETLASVFRSDQLAWKVIVEKRLYASPAFIRGFEGRFPSFRPDAPEPAAQSFLLERFQRDLHVGTLPRTLILEIRFRSRDAALSADVVNALIRDYGVQEADLRRESTQAATAWLTDQLDALKKKSEKDGRRLAEFQRKHGILISSETFSDGRAGATEHLPVLLQVDELGRELAAASSERILREAEYRAAAKGDPEAVLAFDPRKRGDGEDLASTFRLIHTRHSDLEQELAQLTIERGPNFPRVVEIRQQLKDLDRQLEADDAKLLGQFKSAWTGAEEHEALVRKSLAELTGEGLRVNEAATAFQALRREAESTEDLYLRMQDKVEVAGISAGLQTSDIWVVDEARPPARPVAPDLPLYMAIALFAGIWLAVAAVLLMDMLEGKSKAGAIVLLVFVIGSSGLGAQAPTPSTSGLPTGVARIPVSQETREAPNAKDAPAVWNGTAPNAAATGVANNGLVAGGIAMAAPIAPGDVLDVSEFHTPEFHSTVRVSAAGTVTLPMVDEIRVDGMDEREAARVIAAALLSRGMLNHPQVFVSITAYAGQDVSVLGEVARPGVYPYAVHHRLLDVISEASGLTATAGSKAKIYHRGDPDAPYDIALNGEDGANGNPELMPGDTVRISRAGLVYVVGDVLRPGGFTVDPTQEITVVKALTLAWGTTQNAALSKAVLIREQKGGRTVTTLNLKRMLRGQDPDLPIHDRDILFVPNSAMKNLFNRSVESAIQSAAGVSIYAGMVYSQRF